MDDPVHGVEHGLRDLLRRLLSEIGTVLLEESLALFPVESRPGQYLLVVSEELDESVAQIADRANLHRASDYPGLWLHVPKK